MTAGTITSIFAEQAGTTTGSQRPGMQCEVLCHGGVVRPGMSIGDIHLQE